MALAATLKGEVGRSGGDVRSDCRVVFEPCTSGGIAVELHSRVEAYYGDNIHAQVQQVLRALHITDARVLIEDMGALPFVIAARLETAVRRAGLDRREPSSVAASRQPSPKDRLRRSRLYLPGNEPKYFINAALHGPDAVILDLEDSVHVSEKDAARILVRNALTAVDFGAAERMVRIDQLPLGLQDLEEIVPQAPEVILVPKVETAAQIQEVDRETRAIAARCGITKAIWLMPILESALGIENAFAIATASDRICALTLGLEDYTADLGVPKTTGGQESLYARLRVVNAAKAAGLQAIDSVYGDIGDIDGLASWAQHARGVGFEGMGCVHPSQIAVIHKAFAPSQLEIEKALKIVAAFRAAQEKGVAVVSVGSKMVDPPVVSRALKLVQQAKSMGIAIAEREAGR